MASVEHGENFNSPNDNIRISTIENRGTWGDAVKVRLSDGSLFCVSPSAFSERHYREGDLLEDQDIQFLKGEDNYMKTRQKALSLLEYADNSSFRLKVKLRNKGCEEAAILRALEELESAGLIDDRRFAENWIRSRIRTRPAGPPKLIGHLRNRGIPREIAEQTVKEVLDEIDLMTLLDNAAEKLKNKRNITPEQLKEKLLRLGFSYSDIREYEKR